MRGRGFSEESLVLIAASLVNPRPSPKRSSQTRGYDDGVFSIEVQSGFCLLRNYQTLLDRFTFFYGYQALLIRLTQIDIHQTRFSVFIDGFFPEVSGNLCIWCRGRVNINRFPLINHRSISQTSRSHLELS